MDIIVSQNAVPLTIIKGAGNEYIPIPEGESAIVADFHSYVTTLERSRPDHTIYFLASVYSGMF